MNNWFNNIRIYHLLIDRFNGGWQVPPKSENVFCGGNLQGVIEKLDYIKELGFNAIMLSPIFNFQPLGAEKARYRAVVEKASHGRAWYLSHPSQDG